MSYLGLGLVHRQQPPQISEFRPDSRRTSKWRTVSLVKRWGGNALIHVNVAISSTQNADGCEDEKSLKCHCWCCCWGGCCRLWSGSFCAHIRDVSRVDCLIKRSALLDGIANVEDRTFFSYQTEFWICFTVFSCVRSFFLILYTAYVL